jgi:hypothetical protein
VCAEKEDCVAHLEQRQLTRRRACGVEVDGFSRHSHVSNQDAMEGMTRKALGPPSLDPTFERDLRT